jgi:hypothetical protein
MLLGEDRDTIALAHAELMQRAGEVLHLGCSLGKAQRLVAINPAERGLVGMPRRAVIEKLMHQHA